MKFINRQQATKETGLSYIGKVNHSSKHFKAYSYDEYVYTIYLAPALMSGYEVCPMRTNECTLLCLNESGQNLMYNHINESRIKKTKLFFENRDYFMRWIIDEIKYYQEKAKSNGFKFSVRLNNTSDISPEMFYIIENGVKQNILEMFPDVQFYDYTKVFNRIKLLEKYPNYDLTFSYNGENKNEIISLLNNGHRVAIVFQNVPENYLGFKVIDGDKYDMRYKDEKNVIVGLKFKKVRNTLLLSHKFVVQ